MWTVYLEKRGKNQVDYVQQRYFYFEKDSGTKKVTQNLVGEGWCYLYQCQEKGLQERRSVLRPSEKKLPERRSGAFCHQNTPG
jgi:hypothetical protein